MKPLKTTPDDQLPVAIYGSNLKLAPSSILRQTPHARLYLVGDSATKLWVTERAVSF